MQTDKNNTRKTDKSNTNTNLLQFQKPIYQLKRNEEGKVQSIIAQLMQKKDKPQIGFVAPSPRIDVSYLVLEQLRSFMPIIKQSNNQLLMQDIKPEQRIDAKLQPVQDSSSQSEDEENQQDNQMDEMRMLDQSKEQPKHLNSCDQLQFNILTYPYLQNKELTTSEVANQNDTQHVGIVEVEEHEDSVNQLQKME